MCIGPGTPFSLPSQRPRRLSREDRVKPTAAASLAGFGPPARRSRDNETRPTAAAVLIERRRRADALGQPNTTLSGGQPANAGRKRLLGE